MFILYLYGSHDFIFFWKIILQHLVTCWKQISRKRKIKGGETQVNSSIKHHVAPASSSPFPVTQTVRGWLWHLHDKALNLKLELYLFTSGFSFLVLEANSYTLNSEHSFQQIYGFLPWWLTLAFSPESNCEDHFCSFCIKMTELNGICICVRLPCLN